MANGQWNFKSYHVGQYAAKRIKEVEKIQLRVEYLRRGNLMDQGKRLKSGFHPKYPHNLVGIISPEQFKSLGLDPVSDIPEYFVTIPDDHNPMLHDVDNSETGFTLEDLRFEENIERLFEGKDPVNRPPGSKVGVYRGPNELDRKTKR